MRKLANFLLVAAIALGFVACNNEDVPSIQEEGNTHVGIVLNMNAGNVRSHDYNYVGQYAGKDAIKSVAVYIVDVDENVVSTGQYGLGDFNVSNDGTNITITPKKAIKTTPGQKRVYALINGTPEVVAALATANVTDFETAYKTAALKLANDYPTNPSVKSSASNVAKIDNNEDVIVMTNAEECALTVLEGVTEAQAMDATNPLNRAKINVKRVVARVMVTTAAETYEVKAFDGTVLGTVKDITWVLAQGENSFYIQQNADKKSPKYDWVPVFDSTQPNHYYQPYPNDNGYDYSGLFENHNDGTLHFGGTIVPTKADYENAQALQQITDDLNAQLSGKFILPTTHKYGADDQSTNYRKGNTAYVLVRARFTPATMADGTTYTEGNDFYLGANGLFYSTAANAVNPETGGIVGQTVAKYVKGKVLYYAWVNPDLVPGWLNSPVLRNNIYHIHITGFKNIGVNWNPLVPNDDPDNPNDNQYNPDPKPEPDPNDPNYPDEPDNPIDPEDPLTTPETWMSVDMTVLPWEVHSYEVDLGI